MKPRFSILAAFLASFVLSHPTLAGNPRDGVAAQAQSAVQLPSEGTVKKVDTASGRVTLAHGPLVNLNMPAMTMTFAVRDKGALKGIKAGEKVRFRAEQIGDDLVITQLRH